MMKKSVNKHIRITPGENIEWKRKAKQVCMTESALVRMLISGYYPKEKPDDRFYEAMNKLSDFSKSLNQLASAISSQNIIDTQMLYREAESWQSFRADIEKRFLRPEKGE